LTKNEPKTTDESKKKAKLQELNCNNNKPKELFQKPDEIALDFGPELSNIVNNQDLPNWAQSQIKPMKKEEFQLNMMDQASLLNQIDHKFKLSNGIRKYDKRRKFSHE
jgi:hypothetical protein